MPNEMGKEDVRDTRLGYVEREVQALREFRRDAEQTLTKVDFLLELHKETSKKSDAQYDSIVSKVDGITHEVTKRDRQDVAQHTRCEAHIAACDARGKWRAALVASLIVAVSSGVLALVLQMVSK